MFWLKTRGEGGVGMLNHIFSFSSLYFPPFRAFSPLRRVHLFQYSNSQNFFHGFAFGEFVYQFVEVTRLLG